MYFFVDPVWSFAAALVFDQHGWLGQGSSANEALAD